VVEQEFVQTALTMRTLLHLIDTGGPGGAETVFLHLATRLDQERYRSVPVVSRNGWLADRLREHGLSVHILPSRGSINVPYLYQLQRLLRHQRADAIVGHLYGSSVYGSLAGIVTRRPVVSILHGQTDVSATERFAHAKATVVRTGSHRVVFVSAQLRDALQTRLKLANERCAVIENGVDLEAFTVQRDSSLRTDLALPDSKLLVGAIGNIRAPKGYDTLLDAARLLCDSSDRYHFIIAGEGSGKLLERLLAQRARLDLERDVSFLGSRADVARVLNNLDIYVLSSTSEGFSIACVEAMACGLPVVATRSGGPQTIIEDGKSGLLVEPSDPAQIAAAIQRLGNDAALRQELGTQARVRAKDRFSLDAMIRSYDTLLSSVTQGLHVK
jgi:glycosyltransferase involved in cell wall biosynthesis